MKMILSYTIQSQLHKTISERLELYEVWGDNSFDVNETDESMTVHVTS